MMEVPDPEADRRWLEDTMLKAQIRDFSLRCLCHTFASRLVMAGVSL
jgi:site-specific recombinase XerD